MNDSTKNELPYSNEALSVIHSFYGKKCMVYVEGDDDVSFWDAIFEKAVSNDLYEIAPLGGISGKLKKYIQKILKGEIRNVIIACDNDYTTYLNTAPYSSPYIITTYGYSIENTMFCPSNIAVYLKRLSKSTNNYMDVVTKWYDDFCEKAKLLLPYDIANFINVWNGSTEPMTSFLGDNCCRFLENPSSPQLDHGKITQYIDSHKGEYPDDMISSITEKINNDVRGIRNILKGHFLTNGVMNLITKETRAVGHTTKIEKNQMYATFCSCIVPCPQLCQERKEIVDKIKKAFEKLSK